MGFWDFSLLLSIPGSFPAACLASLSPWASCRQPCLWGRKIFLIPVSLLARDYESVDPSVLWLSHRRVCTDPLGRLQVIVSRFVPFPPFFPIYSFRSDRVDIWRLRYQSLRDSCTEIWTCVLQCISLHHGSYKSLSFLLPKRLHMLLCETTQIWGKGQWALPSSLTTPRDWQWYPEAQD